MKRVKEFKSQLGDFDDVFERERRRNERTAAHHEVDREAKSCASKNRYSSESEALVVIDECAAHGTTDLHAYRCPYCDGWHLTSHPWDHPGEGSADSANSADPADFTGFTDPADPVGW